MGSIFILSPRPTEAICLVCRETEILQEKQKNKRQKPPALQSALESESQAVLAAPFLSLNCDRVSGQDTSGLPGSGLQGPFGRKKRHLRVFTQRKPNLKSRDISFSEKRMVLTPESQEAFDPHFESRGAKIQAHQASSPRPPCPSLPLCSAATASSRSSPHDRFSLLPESRCIPSWAVSHLSKMQI